jgi:threonyl-tRNA synthetase
MRRLNILYRGDYALLRRSLVHNDCWNQQSRPSPVSVLVRSCCNSSPAHRRSRPLTRAASNDANIQSPSVSADHRTLGVAQDLFTTSLYSPGSPLFLPNGSHILNKLLSFLRAQYRQYGFREVVTPNIYKKSLWEISGHWQNYKNDMYEVRGRGASGETDGELGEDESYGLKPMNCPGHCLLFKSQVHSYRELPIRYADFSPLHRNEISGSLSGLTRVRRFHQDDGHIFCRPQQIKREIALALGFVEMVMKTFGLGSYRLVLSTRPETDFIGSLDLWENAEAQLRDALNASGRPWELNKGDGAFYGPKIDIQLQDSDGKYHQLSTIQLDLNLPQRFGLEYQVPEGEEDYDPNTPGRATPVLIHRAIFGSLERFLALLIERYAGRWPFWLSPRQAIVLTVQQDEEVIALARAAVNEISGFHALIPDDDSLRLPSPIPSTDPNFLVDLDSSSQSLSKKIQRAKQMRYNLIFVIGPRNVADGTIEVDISAQLQSNYNGVDEGFCRLVEECIGKDALKNPRAIKMKLKDVHPFLKQVERAFL